jgi:putative heme-binding domain-containing protein
VQTAISALAPRHSSAATSPPNITPANNVNLRLMNHPTFRKTCAALIVTASACLAADVPKGVKAPSGWSVTMFAAPPNVSYPTCLGTAPNGDVFVGIDENGSIDAKPNRGRVVRCTDTDGDGTADKFVTFAAMDSPRGIWFDNNVLYVQHPPFVSAFIDENGDGISDRSEVLVQGLGFDLKFRGADHTINGMRMGIDGFLYIACGDYGGTNAVGKDGTRIQLHGGGVVRVRTDGSGLEIVSQGQRNIYDVAVSPELDLFTRDNTNDGDGWDVRLSHVVMGGNYGYPRLFKKFGDEIIQPLADYGGGSPCGALFLDEPGFPTGFGRGLYTVEWGRGGIMRHPLTSNGASFKAAQEKFVELNRPTEFDVDGSGRLYISSWQGATFSYNGPNAGYLLRVTPPDWKLKAFPDLKKASAADLLKHIASPSAFARLYAQREILRRSDSSELSDGLENLALTDAPIPQRAAAIFTLKQLLGEKSHPALIRLARMDAVREFALRALADDTRLARSISAEPFVAALLDANARVRLQAATALGRLGKSDAASALLPLMADNDAVVAHVAVHALAQLRAASVCLQAFDSPGSAKFVTGAGRALQLMHEPQVVEGLLSRLSRATNDETRRILIKTLARLANREDDWNGKWWGTRPDTTGPYFKPVKWSESGRIENALRAELARADVTTLPALAMTLQINRVDLPELVPTMIKLADSDSKFRPVAVDMFNSRATLPDEALPLLRRIATTPAEETALRVKAIRTLAKSAQPAALDAVVAALALPGKSPAALNSAWEEFARDPKVGRNVDYFTRLTASETAEQRVLAYAVLANRASGKISERNGRASAVQAVEKGWTTSAGTLALLQAINRLKLDGYNNQVRGLMNNSLPEVAAAARLTARTLRLDQEPAADALVIEKMKYEEVLAATAKARGEVKAGEELFTRLGCVACHTTSSGEAPKGPFLGGIGTRYSRAELCESILKPNAKIAQGFETQWFKTKDDEEIEGFVTREGGDDLDVRNVAGITATLAKKNIAERAKREKSIMPEGLADKISPGELASLLAFMEGLNVK